MPSTITIGRCGSVAERRILPIISIRKYEDLVADTFMVYAVSNHVHDVKFHLSNTDCRGFIESTIWNRGTWLDIMAQDNLDLCVHFVLRDDVVQELETSSLGLSSAITPQVQKPRSSNSSVRKTHKRSELEGPNATVSLDEICGAPVNGDTELLCGCSIHSCHNHSKEERRAVEGRSAPWQELTARKNQNKEAQAAEKAKVQDISTGSKRPARAMEIEPSHSATTRKRHRIVNSPDSGNGSSTLPSSSPAKEVENVGALQLNSNTSTIDESEVTQWSMMGT